MKKLLIAAVIITLTGCASKVNEDHAHSMAITKSNNAVYSWADKAKMAYTGAFTDMQNYRGQSCTLRLSFGPNAALKNAKADKGAKNLCNVAIQEAWNTKFPPFPDDATYQTFKTFLLDLDL